MPTDEAIQVLVQRRDQPRAPDDGVRHPTCGNNQGCAAAANYFLSRPMNEGDIAANIDATLTL